MNIVRKLRDKAKNASPYSVLNPQKQEIRLCHINVSKTADASPSIHVWLETVRFTSTLEYECLSYVWGTDKAADPIYLNGHPFFAHVNLYAILASLVEIEMAEPIWIDALCVNQNDLEERSQQVALMGEIYKTAKNVIIWLGTSPLQGRNPGISNSAKPSCWDNNENETTKGIQFLRHLSTGVHFHQLPYFPKCDAQKCHSDHVEATLSFSSVLDSLKSLMESEWFNRTWTIQEIVLARLATIWFNGHSFPWRTMVDAWTSWNEHLGKCCGQCILTHKKSDLDMLHQYAAKVLDLESATWSYRRKESLVTPLLKFQGRASKEPLDRIYGLLGLQNGPKAIPMKPDYGIKLSDLFTTFAIGLIRANGWAVPLHLDLSHNIKSLPTWVPDWTYKTGSPPDYAVDPYSACSEYFCCKGMNDGLRIIDGCVLDIAGRSIDTIEEVSCAYAIMDGPASQLDLISKWHQFVDLQTQGENPYVLGNCDVKEAFSYTMFAGVFHERQGCRPVDANDLEDWSAHITECMKRLDDGDNTVIIGLDRGMASHAVACLTCRLFRTTKGYIGLCPEICKAGDGAFVLSRCPAIIFLRQSNPLHDVGDARYAALGHGYIHGMMNGEADDLDLPTRRMLII